MEEEFSRTALLLGEENLDILKQKRVILFGCGGVGGFAAEALARSGVGTIELVDHDTIAVSNLNRQIIALHSTLGRDKVAVLSERLLDINPSLNVIARPCFFLPENADEFDFSSYDYVIDAVDTVTAKLEIIERCQRAGTPVISSMGAGNKLDPTLFRVADIYETSICPLARVMRKELKKRGIESLKVVFSTEPPISPVKGEMQVERKEDLKERSSYHSEPQGKEKSDKKREDLLQKEVLGREEVLSQEGVLSQEEVSGQGELAQKEQLYQKAKAQEEQLCQKARAQKEPLCQRTKEQEEHSRQKDKEQEMALAQKSVGQVLVQAKSSSRRSTPGSVAWVPSVAGLILGGEVVKDLLAQEK
ncbi:MAG: ThiF family adenylyltransferase [Lachnospiraceae bacterium]|nr:ThiF family adenylyltransferase [Lachnospiraceae bacterium]